MKTYAPLVILMVVFLTVQANAQSVKVDDQFKMSSYLINSIVGADPVTMGDRFIIDSSDDGKERQFPFVYKFGKDIFVSYAEHIDKVVASPTDAMMISRDNGKTWKEKLTKQDFYITSMFKKKGILYGIVYFTYPVSPTTERMIYWTSDDNGKTWSKKEGIVKAPDGKQFKPDGTNRIWGSMLFHRGMKVMKDGSVQGVMYGHFAGDQLYSCVWVKSTDNCTTWQIVSVIATGKPKGETAKAEGYCEPGFAITRDGSILCVMRIGSYLPLYQSRSLDKGLTWSTPVVLPGLKGKSLQSVCPDLLLMKNGVLALTYGRPGTRMAFSADGCGYNWNYAMETYEGETTGYSGIVEQNPGKLLLVSDQGRTGDKALAIWGSFLDVHMKPTATTYTKLKK